MQDYFSLRPSLKLYDPNSKPEGVMVIRAAWPVSLQRPLGPVTAGLSSE